MSSEGLNEDDWNAITRASWHLRVEAWRADVERIVAAREAAAATKARAEAGEQIAQAIEAAGQRWADVGRTHYAEAARIAREVAR